MGDTDVQRLRDAKSHIEAQLIENLIYLTRSELKTYVKCDDEIKAFHMIKDYINCDNINDDDIRFQCGLIGNTLHHRSRDWAKDNTYQPKRVTRQSTSNMSSHDLMTKTSSPSATPNNGSNGSTTFPRSSQENGRTNEVLHDSDDPNQSLTTSVKSTHNTSPAAEISTAADSVEMHCSMKCKYGRRDAKDMVGCSLCYTWYHEDCIGYHYSRNTDSHWWLCIKCRQMPNTLVTLNDTVLQLSGYVSQLVDQNKILTEMVNELKQSNSKIKAEQSNIQKSTDQDRNSREISNDSPSLILGDSTIRDVVPNDEHRLYVCSKDGAKTSDILAMLKKVKQNAYGDIMIHVGTNDTATKYPETKIVENVSSILDVAKDKSRTGNVTLSGICPRIDDDMAADRGKNINATNGLSSIWQGLQFHRPYWHLCQS